MELFSQFIELIGPPTSNEHLNTYLTFVIENEITEPIEE